MYMFENLLKRFLVFSIECLQKYVEFEKMSSFFYFQEGWWLFPFSSITFYTTKSRYLWLWLANFLSTVVIEYVAQFYFSLMVFTAFTNPWMHKAVRDIVFRSLK